MTYRVGGSWGVADNYVMIDCDCGYNGDLYLCINGEVYGPCDNENCGGVCDPVGRCTCECHTTPEAKP